MEKYGPVPEPAQEAQTSEDGEGNTEVGEEAAALEEPGKDDPGATPVEKTEGGEATSPGETEGQEVGEKKERRNEGAEEEEEGEKTEADTGTVEPAKEDKEAN